jgi:hypothetical protein
MDGEGVCGNGGRVKNPTEAGLRFYDCLLLVAESTGGGPYVRRETVGGE